MFWHALVLCKNPNPDFLKAFTEFKTWLGELSEEQKHARLLHVVDDLAEVGTGNVGSVF